MILTVILALSICELLCFDTAATVIFTILFSVCSFSAMIYCKLAFALDEEEVEVIRSYIIRAQKLKKKIKMALSKSKRKPVRLGERVW